MEGEDKRDRYCWPVLQRAWRQTWQIVMQHSFATLARDAALLVIAVFLLFWMQARLVDSGAMSGDNAGDTIVWILIGAVALVVLFSAVFVFEALFIVPRQMWQEVKEETRTLKSETSARISHVEGELERLRESMRPRIVFDGLRTDKAFAQDVAAAWEVSQLVVRVHNPGAQLLERCLVKIESIRSNDSYHELQGALRTVARQDDEYVGRFELGPGEHKRVVLTSRAIGNPRMPDSHKIECETGTFRLDRGHSATIDLIAIAEIGGPDRLRVRLSVDDRYGLTHEVLPITEG